MDRLIRTLILSLARPEDGQPAAALPRPEGVTELSVETPGRVRVAYDLRHADLPAVERWLAANGVKLAGGPLHRLRRRWIAFTDDNRRDQASIAHQCCSVPPRRE